MIAFLGLSVAAPDFDALDRAAWKDVGERATRVGPVALRASYVHAVGCVEGQVQVTVSSERLLAVTADMASAKEWSSADLSHSRELSRDAEGFVLFQRLEVPAWTLSSDRFWVLRGVNDATIQRYRWYRLEAAHHPEVKDDSHGAIEPPVNYGEWSFRSHDEGTLLRYRACVDFGGPVPAAVQRWITTQQVPALIEDLVEEAGRR
jgi:hypothetical protein